MLGALGGDRINVVWSFCFYMLLFSMDLWDVSVMCDANGIDPTLLLLLGWKAPLGSLRVGVLLSYS